MPTTLPSVMLYQCCQPTYEKASSLYFWGSFFFFLPGAADISAMGGLGIGKKISNKINSCMEMQSSFNILFILSLSIWTFESVVNVIFIHELEASMIGLLCELGLIKAACIQFVVWNIGGHENEWYCHFERVSSLLKAKIKINYQIN